MLCVLDNNNNVLNMGLIVFSGGQTNIIIITKNITNENKINKLKVASKILNH